MNLISVIIPVYKVEKYLNKCVESVVNQSYKNIEIILIDDGSPDNCPQMCDEWAKKDCRIKVIHKENGGLTTVRKIGAQNATGDYIVFVDSDDWIDKDYLKEFVDVIDKYEPDIISCDYNRFNSEKFVIYCKQQYEEGLYLRDKIERDIFPSLIASENGISFQTNACWKAIKTELFRQEQFQVPDKIRYSDDTVCIIPCIYKSQSMYILHKGMYYYRNTPNSQCNSPKPFSIEYPFDVYNHLTSRLNIDESDFKLQIYRRFILDFFAMSVSQFYSSEPYRNTKKRLLNLFNNDILINACNEAKFTNIAMNTKLMLLKRKMIPLIYLLGKYRLSKRIRK